MRLMMAIITGRTFQDLDAGTGPVVAWLARTLGDAAPVVVDIFVLCLVALSALFIVWKMKLPRRR